MKIKGQTNSQIEADIYETKYSYQHIGTWIFPISVSALLLAQKIG